MMMDLDDDVLRPLYDRCCQFAHDALRAAEARGDVLVGTPTVVVDVRRGSIALVMVGADDYAPEIALEAGDAALAALVERFLAAGLRRLAPEIARQATDRHVSGVATLALLVPLDGGVIRIACVSVDAADPRRQWPLFASMLDARLDATAMGRAH